MHVSLEVNDGGFELRVTNDLAVRISRRPRVVVGKRPVKPEFVNSNQDDDDFQLRYGERATSSDESCECSFLF